MENILLWGSKSQAKIIENMVNEIYPNIQLNEMFDPLNKKPAYKTNLSFSNTSEELKKIIEKVSHFIICIGNEYGYARHEISEVLKNYNLLPTSIVSENAFVDKTAIVGEGLQMMPGSVVQKFVNFGNQCIFNTNSSIDHDCIIGNGVHIMPGATICGRVNIKDFSTIGSNSTILPDITIGEGSFIGAGSVISKNVLPYSVIVGTPGKYIRKNRLIYNNDIFRAM